MYTNGKVTWEAKKKILDGSFERDDPVLKIKLVGARKNEATISVTAADRSGVDIVEVWHGTLTLHDALSISNIAEAFKLSLA